MADYWEENDTYGRKLSASSWDDGATDAANEAAKQAEEAAKQTPCTAQCPESNCLEKCEYTQSDHTVHRCPLHGDF